jgi:hypothetical protein
VDALESDFSVFHRIDMWVTSMATLMRLAPKLPAYGGALALAIGQSERPAAATAPPEVSTGYTQPVHTPAAPDDTPPDVVASKWAEHLVAKYRSMGVEVTGIQPIGDDEMERLVSGGR